ncbi:hypothetical protein AVEN_141622-1 [Araneus ventricosus]|uniref:ribonuclease H n=1 Tax=Araneus ventricosus TaxID=182803 RepID=A0A4Y2MHF0_ARAVE|nr:hypothetical protein AVEN_141622-1 [Araneus ventricosus]
MALQIINENPGEDIQIYTDGSRNEENQSGSGIYIKTPREVKKIKLRNPDNCSVFRSELLAIEAGLKTILNENNYGTVWILSDSRSSIQHLKDWNNVGDRTGISILKLLRHIGVDHEVHLQWIPSHAYIYGNEVTDDLVKQGTAEPLCSAPSLTFDEIYSIRKNKDLKTWRVPLSHDWYKRSSPGGSIGLACDRADQTAVSRFLSGHLRSCSFSHGNKVFPVCAKCGVASASPEHILSCLRLSRETFETDPLLALDFLRNILILKSHIIESERKTETEFSAHEVKNSSNDCGNDGIFQGEIFKWNKKEPNQAVRTQKQNIILLLLGLNNPKIGSKAEAEDA